MSATDLYTSQVHLKRLLAGQSTPAFTPAPESTLKVLDPAFFPGMGAMNEDDKGRVQCPVRGCGEWHFRVAAHLNRSHGGIGGAETVKRALDIPKRVSLLSARAKEMHREHTMIAANRTKPLHLSVRGVGGKSKGRPAGGHNSINARNWSDTCPAQLQAKIVALSKTLGHSPRVFEFVDRYGADTLKAVLCVFGTWNNAKNVCGLDAVKPGRLPMARSVAVESLGEYFRINGDLPSSEETNLPSRCPRIPRYATILRALNVDTWEAAMRTVIESLDIVSYRYGSPKSPRAKHNRPVALTV